METVEVMDGCLTAVKGRCAQTIRRVLGELVVLKQIQDDFS